MRRAALSLVVVASLFSLIACGGGSNSANTNSNSGLSSGSGGSGGGSGSTPSSSFLYVAESTNNNTGLMEVFSVDASGVLTMASGSPFSTQTSNTTDLAISPGNNFAYLMGQQFGSGCCVGPYDLQVFALDPTTGAPTLHQSLSTGNSAFEHLTMHPSGKFLYVSPWNSDDTGTGIYTIAADGTVAFSGTSESAGNDAPVITPDGKYMYMTKDAGPVGNWENTQACGPVITDVYAYSIDASTGALTPLSKNPEKFKRDECDVGFQSTILLKAVDAQSQRLFLVDEANDKLLVFPIAANGEAKHSSTMSVAGFSSLAIDPLKPFLYIGGVLQMTGYDINGAPAPIPGMPVAVPPVPADNETGSTTMAIDPTGSYLFSNENGYTSAFSCCDPDGLVEFKIDQNSGALTQITVTPANLKGSASKMAFAKGQ
jgi:6-phosphogluconolactonase (cycloisomerase 2 family)